ncbi:hypothetical protein F3Y22_tig00112261pilonHSYRG00063 [Hibiscus syriacus]|uniref:Uncharacterized protein n=1 Tax=Hibiscus syriacus TaxID=106335 RepID=A0A6A2X2E6_HIBSY|nr:hypothetical protein F3Y22_tig00112261pilonHSYRG00063 [Hibiscus syriacus]
MNSCSGKWYSYHAQPFYILDNEIWNRKIKEGTVWAFVCDVGKILALLQSKPILKSTYTNDVMSSSEYSMHGINSDGFKAQDSEFLKRHSSETHLAPSKSNEDGNYDFQGPEAKELHLRVGAQKEEIQHLREQIAVTCVKELQLLNEKCALERKFSDLRMAIHEKQNEYITSASNELARRKGDLEENLKLTHDLKVKHSVYF